MQLGIGFRLAPDAAVEYNITKIELTVSAPDMDEPRLFPITDINNEERTARGTIWLDVTRGASFSVKAFEQKCPVLSGLLENVEITQDGIAPVIITLVPIQTIVGIRSLQDQVSVGGNYSLEVYVEDAPGLFAFSCELRFEPNLLQPMEVVPGDFFGSDFLFIEDSEFPRRDEDRLVLGITLKGDAPGVCGSGVVFRVTFQTTAAEDAVATFLENVTLTTPAFEKIEDSSRVRLEPNAIVRIQ